MKEKFSTYSVIPTEIMLSNDLSSTAKILYGVISSLTNEKGYCWASNDYLGSLLNISSKTASLLIKELSDYGYIQSDVEKNYKRKIFLGGITKMFRGYNKNVKGVLQKCKDNNIKEYYKDNIYIADKSANDKKPINKGKGVVLESNILKVSDLYDKMELPKQTRKVEKWQDSASIVVKEMNVPENKISSVFKCFKDHEREAMFALRDCKELGKMNVFYFLKVYNELVKKNKKN